MLHKPSWRGDARSCPTLYSDQEGQCKMPTALKRQFMSCTPRTSCCTSRNRVLPVHCTSSCRSCLESITCTSWSPVMPLVFMLHPRSDAISPPALHSFLHLDATAKSRHFRNPPVGGHLMRQVLAPKTPVGAIHGGGCNLCTAQVLGGLGTSD